MSQLIKWSALESRVSWTVLVLVLLWVGWYLGQEFSDFYSGDLDHEIYYGQRILYGELPWTFEFFDKLPGAQFIQAISALLGGIQAWRAISIIGAVISSIVILLKLPDLFTFYLGFSLRKSKVLAAFVVGTYFLLMSIVPGGFTTINALPTSIFMASTVILYCRLVADSHPRLFRAFWGPAFFFAIAITLRPYFIGPFLALVVWLALESVRKKRREAPKLRSSFQIVLLTGIWGGILNVLPYVLIGDLQPFLDGILAIADGTRAEFSAKSLAFLAASFLLSFAGALWLIRRDGFGFPSQVFASSAFLVLVIFSQHFWNHYVAFFAWFASIGFWIVIAIVAPRLLHHRLETGTKCFSHTVAVVFSLALTLSLVYGEFVREGFSHRRHDYPVIVNALYENFGTENVSFIAPRDMYSHWLFSESRRGLPGGAATRPIRDGLWAEKEQFESFSRPRSLEEYCALIQESGVRFALVVHDYLPRTCFATPDGEPWTLVEMADSRDLPPDIWVLENPKWDGKGKQRSPLTFFRKVA